MRGYFPFFNILKFMTMPKDLITEEKKKQWKALYGHYFELKIGDKTCYLKPLSRQVLGYSSIQRDPVKRYEIILNELWLGGDEAIKTDDSYFLGTIPLLDRLIEVRSGEIKKV